MPNNSIAFRPARNRDFDYCRRLYFSEMGWIIEKLHLDKPAQEAYLQTHWKAQQVRIIVLDGADVGWLQTILQDDALFLAQMFVERRFQRRGIGTQVMQRLIDEATRAGQPMRLTVVKINPARRLYERLGFNILQEDKRKLYMQRDPLS